MSGYRIVITHRAYLDITECVEFVKAVSQESAKLLHKEIMDSLKNLDKFPYMYPEIEGLSVFDNSIRKMVIHGGRYSVIYKIEKDLIVIYDILDSRKDNKVFF